MHLDCCQRSEDKLLNSAQTLLLAVDATLWSGERLVSTRGQKFCFVFKKKKQQKTEYLYFADSTRIIYNTDAGDACCGYQNMWFWVSFNLTVGNCLKEEVGKRKIFYQPCHREAGRTRQKENKVYSNILYPWAYWSFCKQRVFLSHTHPALTQPWKWVGRRKIEWCVTKMLIFVYQLIGQHTEKCLSVCSLPLWRQLSFSCCLCLDRNCHNDRKWCLCSAPLPQENA